jgi:hypothetical protein
MRALLLLLAVARADGEPPPALGNWSAEHVNTHCTSTPLAQPTTGAPLSACKAACAAHAEVQAADCHGESALSG